MQSSLISVIFNVYIEAHIANETYVIGRQSRQVVGDWYNFRGWLLLVMPEDLNEAIVEYRRTALVSSTSLAVRRKTDQCRLWVALVTNLHNTRHITKWTIFARF